MTNRNNCYQKINCTVGSCLYNNYHAKECELDQIEVSACQGCSNGNPAEESMCASYRNRQTNPNTNNTNYTNNTMTTEQYYS